MNNQLKRYENSAEQTMNVASPEVVEFVSLLNALEKRNEQASVSERTVQRANFH